MKVLIPGISSGVARGVANVLAARGHQVIGIDPRPWTGHPKNIEVHAVDIRKRAGEDVFRKSRPDAVIHMGTVSTFSLQGEQRERINLGGTRAVFEHCRTYGVKQVVFVGRHTYYGASPDAPLYHVEEEPPQALDAFPELADVVAADLYAGAALWRMPELTTSVLRLCYTLGRSRHGTLSSFLRGRRVPMVLGHDPLFHFLHEKDAIEAVALALEKKLRGVYNVAGPQPLPLSVIIRETGRTAIPLPESVLKQFLGRFGFPRLSPGALDHLKYAVVIDASAFRKATGFQHQHDEVQTLRMFRELDA